MMNSCDRRFMALALEQAEEAARAGEVPVGAVAVVGGKAVVSARNRVEERGSATAHAELELLHKLELLRGDWRMEDVTVYVTKEPCPMCAGALVNARVRRIVFRPTPVPSGNPKSRRKSAPPKRGICSRPSSAKRVRPGGSCRSGCGTASTRNMPCS